MRKLMTWFRSYNEDWLANGICTHLSLSQQAVFQKLQAVASANPDRGTIQMAPGMPYTPKQLAYRLHIKTNILTSTLTLLKQIGKVFEDGEGIHIINWDIDQGGIQPPLPGIDDHAKAPGRPLSKKAQADKYANQKYGDIVQR